MKYSMQKIGPKEALKLLEGNDANRGIKKVHLEWLRLQMNEDKWRPQTGESIKISKTGKLIDGQHRLNAIVKSGKTYEFLVVTDLEDEVYTVIDSGVSRTGGDALHVLGVSSAYSLSAIIRAYSSLELKDFDGGKNVKRINSEDIVNMYKTNPVQWEALNNKAGNLYVSFHRTLTQKFIGSWYKYLSERAPEKAEEFFSKLCLGVNIKTTIDSVGVYRDWLIDMKMNRMRQTSKDRNGYFILAWNTFIEGKKFRRQSWNPTKDLIPEILLPEKK